MHLDRWAIAIGFKFSRLPSQAITEKRVGRNYERENNMDTGKQTVTVISFVVDGTPVAQPRHRATARGGFVHHYLPTEHPIHAYKQSIAIKASEQNVATIEGAIRLDLLFSFLHPKRNKNHKAQFKISKPDLDNLEKAVMDSLTDSGIWCDDAQVVEKHSAKIFGDTQGTCITIRAIEFPIVIKEK